MTAAPDRDLRALRALPGLGRASAELLAEIGITTPEMLRRIGPIEAWRRLRFAHGRRITLTWIYALDTAVRDIPWTALTAGRMRTLRAAAEAIIAQGPEGRAPTKRSPKPPKRV